MFLQIVLLALDIVPYSLNFTTYTYSPIRPSPLHQLGWLDVPPGQLIVLPRGLVFRVEVDGPSRGYVLEVFKGHFDLPDLGPIGSNGLANARDFEYPVAAYDDDCSEVGAYDWKLVNKFGGNMFETEVSYCFMK